jgi:hypothetical protein
MTCRLCGGMPYAVVVASWVLRIDRDAPSQNILASNKGGARFKYKREREAWVTLLSVEKARLRAPEAGKPRRVQVRRLYSGRKKQRDMGNLIGGLKPVIDALKWSGWIVDDSPAWVEVHYSQERVASGDGTLITIEELA